RWRGCRGSGECAPGRDRTGRRPRSLWTVRTWGFLLFRGEDAVEDDVQGPVGACRAIARDECGAEPGDVRMPRRVDVHDPRGEVGEGLGLPGGGSRIAVL